MVVCFPLKESDYAHIIFLVKCNNPFVSGNNNGLNTPPVPTNLSLVNKGHTFPTKRKASSIHTQDNSHENVQIGNTHSMQDCLHKKFKTAYETGRVIDLTNGRDD